MKNLILLFSLLAILSSCKNESSESEKIAKTESSTNAEKAEFAIIIHGGAGTILKKNMTDEKEAAYKAKLEEAIRVGYEVLKNG